MAQKRITETVRLQLRQEIVNTNNVHSINMSMPYKDYQSYDCSIRVFDKVYYKCVKVL